DLVSGVARGNYFNVVILGSDRSDTFDETASTENYYINGGMGNDRLIGGGGRDFLVGGAGDDRLIGRQSADSFIGGAGDDFILGAVGNDRAFFNVSTDGSDRTNLGSGQDVVEVSANEPGQVRLTFTSSEVGDRNADDSNTGENQDGGLAVRLQLEGADDTLTGSVSRFDDEGITFRSTTEGVTFDVRDLTSGTERGDQFDAVVLGTSRRDGFNFIRDEENYYVNGGQGDDRIVGGRSDDFLVGGAGNDRLTGKGGDDMMIGGGGEDTFVFNGAPGEDTILDFTSGSDQIDLSAYGITSDDVDTQASGDDTIVRVDANQDGNFDFRIILENSAPPAQTDYVF
ncbi:MAG TPA: hypothetical protein VF589_06415, partial [Allosphingosinicella sp.]